MHTGAEDLDESKEEQKRNEIPLGCVDTFNTSLLTGGIWLFEDDIDVKTLKKALSLTLLKYPGNLHAPFRHGSEQVVHVARVHCTVHVVWYSS